jgi:hypothetical protein
MKVTCSPDLYVSMGANVIDQAAKAVDYLLPQSSGTILDTGPFSPVGLGQSVGCQQLDSDDPFSSPDYVLQPQTESLHHCKQKCRLADVCTGVEYLEDTGECRIWKQSIGSGVNASGTMCLRHEPKGFSPVGIGNGQGEACSGIHRDTYLYQDYPTVLDNVTMYQCKVHCARKQTCSGIEYREGDGRCQVWMLEITNTTPVEGVTCLRYSQPGFRLQDGGVGRACRGVNVTDASTLLNTLNPLVISLHDCQVHCSRTTFCYGISYDASSGRCEVWTNQVRSSVESNNSTCLTFEPQPSSSLLCVSLALPFTHEPDLLEMQLKERESIFGCDDFAVYSHPQISLGGGAVLSRDLGFDLHCKKGGPYNTVQNTPIFVKFWERLIRDGAFKSNAWTVKIDPDAVFFPRRLRDIVRQYYFPHSAAYLNNCQLGLHGPVEVMSRRSLEVYYAQYQTCEKPGMEDVYLQRCFDKTGVTQINRWDLLAERDCWRKEFVKDPHWYLCKSAHVSFHPFKKTKDYHWCVYNARNSRAWRHGTSKTVHAQARESTPRAHETQI